jgi:sec-independent protein translocase protein TatC
MSSEEQKGPVPASELVPVEPESTPVVKTDEDPSASETTHVSHEQTTDADHDSHYYDGYTYDDPYSQVDNVPATTTAVAAPLVPASSGGGTTPPPASTPDEEDEEDDGMLRMSFLEHLEELRSRLIKALGGVAVAFLLSMIFANEIWKAISDPAAEALTRLGYPPTLKQLSPTDAFTVIWMKVPLLTATFLSSPWILYQVWSFISPGLYKKERRFAAPFIICTAGLFVMGGLFAYFVAFRFGLEFLLGMGKDINVEPAINLVDYFDLFVNVSLGIGLVFEMPVAVFFLTFLRITTAKFLLANSRYAILIIVILAAVVTPTPDIFNLMIFSVPMVFLYFVGVFASYLLELRRNDESFPWASVLVIVASLAAVVAGLIFVAVTRYGYKLVPAWPFLLR